MEFVDYQLSQLPIPQKYQDHCVICQMIQVIKRS